MASVASEALLPNTAHGWGQLVSRDGQVLSQQVWGLGPCILASSLDLPPQTKGPKGSGGVEQGAP